MRRGLVILIVTVACLIAAPVALATTETANSGNVTATFTFQGKVPKFHGLHLTISRSATVVYDQPVAAKFCGKLCWPGQAAIRSSAVHVVDLEGTGDPDVVLDLYSGGAHCCTVEQVFSFNPATATYVKAEQVFGDPEARSSTWGTTDTSSSSPPTTRLRTRSPTSPRPGCRLRS